MPGYNPSEDNQLMAYLRSKNVTVFSLVRILGLTYPTVKKWLRDPVERLTLKHYLLLAGVTNTPVLYIIALANGFNHKNSKIWYKDQMQAIDLSFLTNIPNDVQQGTKGEVSK